MVKKTRISAGFSFYIIYTFQYLASMINKSILFVKQFEKNLWVLSLGWFVGAMGFAISIPFVSIYFYSELGLSMTQIGLFFGLMAIIRSIFQLVGGEIADRIERRYLLVHTQIIRSFAFLGMAYAIYQDLGFWYVAGAMALNSVFGAMFHPAANAMVSDILPPEKRLDGYAITRSAGNLGWAAGPAIGGFLAGHSYGFLFVMSAVITMISGIVFWVYMESPNIIRNNERFKFKDLIAIKNDPSLAKHSILIFILYLVVAQLIAPFSVYSVEMVGITESQLGWLYTLNGILVVSCQILITRLFAKRKYTVQLAIGSFIYAFGYTVVGLISSFHLFILAIMVITTGEMIMSPPSLALTSKMAPEGRMGRYMGIFGFFVASGWSFGPMYGGFILDHFGHTPLLAWGIISSLALVSGIGYIYLTKILPKELNSKDDLITSG